MRHRASTFNEYSGRYSILEREFYTPAPEHLAAQSLVNNQGRGKVLAGPEAERVLEILTEDAARNYDHYAEMINDASCVSYSVGMPKVQPRPIAFDSAATTRSSNK